VLNEIHARKLDNLRIMRADAVEVVRKMLPRASVRGFHIFFPDPWPKKKHHKRRLFQAEFARLLAEKLEPGGYIYAVTDWREYAEQMIEVIAAEELLRNPFEKYAPPRPWRPGTSYEHKGLQKSQPILEVWAVKCTREYRSGLQ
jgi:tRNA (guanine-N7-)-methyltransferase